MEDEGTIEIFLDCFGERIETPSATRVEVVYGNTAGVR